MADFVLKKVKGFTFEIETSPGKEFEIPHTGSLTFTQNRELRDILKVEDVKEQGERIKALFLELCPDLDKAGIGDADYFSIFNAYVLTQGKKVGESQA